MGKRKNSEKELDEHFRNQLNILAEKFYEEIISGEFFESKYWLDGVKEADLRYMLEKVIERTK